MYKRLITVMIVLLLVGCERVMFEPSSLDRGKEVCEINEGVSYWVVESPSSKMTSDLFIKVWCNNEVSYYYKVER